MFGTCCLGGFGGGGVQVCFLLGDRGKHLKCDSGLIPFLFVQLFPPSTEQTAPDCLVERGQKSQ